MVVNCNDIRYECERSSATEAYMKMIRTYEPLNNKEVRRLIASIQKPASLQEQSKAMDRVILHNQRFVISIAKKWMRGDNLPDLINEGNIGLIQAVCNFDLSKDVKFSTYAAHWINQSIRNYIITKDNIVHPPNTNRIFHYSRLIRNEFYHEHQRYPTLDELSDAIEKRFNFKVPDKRDLMEVQRYGIDIDDEEETVSNDVRNCIISQLSDDSCMSELWNNEDMRQQVESMLNVLTNREREVIGLYFGLDRERCTHGEEMSTNNIALTLGLSVQRVRQLIENGIQRMKKSFSKKELVEN